MAKFIIYFDSAGTITDYAVCADITVLLYEFSVYKYFFFNSFI